MIRVLDTGLVYRNPRPNIYAIHAWHPTILVPDENSLIATFDLGQAVESLDYRTYLSRSGDCGKTWTSPVSLFPEGAFDVPGKTTTHLARPTLLSGGRMVTWVFRTHRPDPTTGYWNPKTGGTLDNDYFIARSDDLGKTWVSIEPIQLPIAGPFEACHSIIVLADGRWLWPTSTLCTWEGESPYGTKAVAFISEDEGRTWTDYITLLDKSDYGISHFETSLVQMVSGDLLTVGWAIDVDKAKTEAVNWAISTDAAVFTLPSATGLAGETSKLLALPDGRAVCVYRSIDPKVPGLFATLVEIKNNKWCHSDPVTLWQGHGLTRISGKDKMSDELGQLKLGYPSIRMIDESVAMVAFWCYEADVYNIRWVKFRICD